MNYAKQIRDAMEAEGIICTGETREDLNVDGAVYAGPIHIQISNPNVHGAEFTVCWSSGGLFYMSPVYATAGEAVVALKQAIAQQEVTQ